MCEPLPHKIDCRLQTYLIVKSSFCIVFLFWKQAVLKYLESRTDLQTIHHVVFAGWSGNIGNNSFTHVGAIALDKQFL